MIAVRTQFTADDLAGRDLAVLRGQIARSIPLSAGRYNKPADRRPRSRGSRSCASCRASTRPTGRRRQLAAAAGLARLGQPLHRGVAWTRTTGSGCSCTPARAAWATRSPSSTSGRRRSWCRAAVDPAARPRPGLPGGGHAGVRRLHRDAAVGAAVRLLNREEMMDRVVDLLRTWLGAPVERPERDQLPPQLHRARGALRQGGVAVPQGRDRGARRAARADPGLDGHGVLRRRGQGQRAVAEVLAARRRAELLPHGARGGCSPRASSRGDGRHRVRDTDAFLDEIPAAYKDDRPVSWPTPPTWSRSGTRCARSSTSRATR